MNISDIPTITLNDGASMPAIGLGTYKLSDDDARRIVRAGIAAGYRHIDTASFYGNEEAVGAGIRDAIVAGDVTREELFVATKAWNNEQGATETPAAFEASLKRLGLDYLDLYLVHWPYPRQNKFVEAFTAMAKLRDDGRTHSIGVCNFYEEVLDTLISETGIAPVINQVEAHVGFPETSLREYAGERGVATEAWAPIARGALLDDPVVTRIADTHDATPTQVCLAYLLQQGYSVIPKTATEHRLAENLGAVSVELSTEDIAALGELHTGRMSGDPHTFPAD